MSYPFDPEGKLIVVPVRLQGSAGDIVVRLALDTGASTSLVSREALTLIGYDLNGASDYVKITTGSSVESAPRITVAFLEALEQKRQDFAVLAHTLPPTASVDGVLGLDFFRGHRLVIDFRQKLISVE